MTQEERFKKFLKDAGITVICEFKGVTTKDNWNCDAWEIFLIKNDKEAYCIPYFTGIGRRSQDVSLLEIFYRLINEATARGYPNFESWCEDFGYDPDSRNHEKVYQSCLKSAEILDKLFSDGKRRQLEELLEDY